MLNLVKNVLQKPNWNGSSCVQAIKLYSPQIKAAEHKTLLNMVPVLR